MTDSTPPIFDAVDALLEAVATGAVLPPPPSGSGCAERQD